MSNAGRKLPEGIKRTMLDPLVKYKLMQLVEKEYAASGMGDKTFAEKAATELGCPEVNSNHIYGCRAALGIPVYTTVRTEITLEAFVAFERRLTALEMQLAALSGQTKG